MEKTSSGENLGGVYYIEENSIDGFKNPDFEKEHFVDTNSMEGLEDLEFAENEKDQPMKSSLYKGPPEPCIGLIFEEWEDALTCYTAYARRKGFSVRKNRARRSRTDTSVIGVEFCELLAMGEEEDDNDDVDINSDLGSAPLLEGGTQLLSNMTFTLHDPPHVASKGRPKSLRQKHPIENQVGKRRKCGICRRPGHIRTNCPTQKEARDDAGGTSSSPTILNVSTNQTLHEASLDFNSPIIVSQDPQHSTFMDLMMEATYTSF